MQRHLQKIVFAKQAFLMRPAPSNLMNESMTTCTRGGVTEAALAMWITVATMLHLQTTTQRVLYRTPQPTMMIGWTWRRMDSERRLETPISGVESRHQPQKTLLTLRASRFCLIPRPKRTERKPSYCHGTSRARRS